MSTSVDTAALGQRIAELGAVAYLVTVGGDDLPHVVSVRVAWDGDLLEIGAGRTSSTNAERHPAVTLLWPAPPGSGYALIVDGTARPVPDGTATTLVVHPDAAVLHRTPEGDPAAPSCIRLSPSP